MTNYVEDHYHHHDMPEDVLIGILTRLPMKSLLRFKCICKYWYALILKPTSTNHHLNFQKGDDQGRLLLQHYNSHSYQYGLCPFSPTKPSPPPHITPESKIDRWIEFWVMELEASWIKQFTIEALPRIGRPLGFWNNSEFLFEASDSPKQYCNDSSQVVLYDLATQEFRDIGPKGAYYQFKARTYYESLVSVKGEKHQRTEKLSDSAAAYYFFKSGCRFVFMFDFVDFMSDFQVNKQWNTELMYTDIDHIRVGGMLTRVWESSRYYVDAFMDDFVNFKSDFQINKQWNTEAMDTDIDHIKVRGMLTRVWESSEYSVDLPD